jgi:hypothetical protein
MKRIIIALSLFATPVMAQDACALLDHLGVTHNEGATLNQAMLDVVAADRERTANKATIDAKDAEIAKLRSPPTQ